MRIDAISTRPSYALQNTRNLKDVVSPIVSEPQPPVVPVLHLSFQGNPSKRPEQISAFATESNYLGGIYCSGGLGDVANALPESIGKEGEKVAGKKLDMRTFLPYYSMDDNLGRIYVLRAESVGKIKEYDEWNKAHAKDKGFKKKMLTRKDDFILVDQNYKLKEGERFALITELQDTQQVKNFHLLNDVSLDGTVERMAEKTMDMEKVPYRVFEVDTKGKRNDRMYLIHTYEHGKGKSSYGIFHTHPDPNLSKFSGGAYSGASAFSGGSNAYGGSSAYSGASVSGASTAPDAERKMHYVAPKTNDMFYTESMRAYQELTMEGKMNTEAHGKFNPQNHMFHDRFCYTALSDATQKANKGDKNYQGLKFVEILHNPGAGYQGKYANPLDFFRIVATQDDLAKLKANEHYAKVCQIAEKIENNKATVEESTQLYKFFRPYFAKMMDTEGLFNMTMLAVRMTDENPANSNVGNVSKNYGNEARNLDMIDIAKGLTQPFIDLKEKMVDVVNGETVGSMETNEMGKFFGSGKLNEVMKTQYKPYAASDSVDKIFKAKQENKKIVINTVAAATKDLDKDKDAVAKVFFNDNRMKSLRKAAEKNEANLPLTVGGLSEYKNGDFLFTSWGRPDAQKGYPITLEAFEQFFMDESIPLETRKHCKLIMGAGSGDSTFNGDNVEWKSIKETIDRIGQIEAGGEKGAFKNNVLFVNGFFPKRIANCVDAGIFTSRFEPCGITPLESYAAGVPVISIRTGGAPDFVKPGKTGLLTETGFMLNPEKLGLASNVDDLTLDNARKTNSAKQVAQQIKAYIEPMKDGTWEAKQKEYIKNCFAEKIGWNENHSYNGGKSALEIYLKDKFNVMDNNIPDTYASDMRGEFDNTAFMSRAKGKTGGKGGKWAIIIGGLLAVAGLGYAGMKKGWFSHKENEKKDENKNLSCVA